MTYSRISSTRLGFIRQKKWLIPLPFITKKHELIPIHFGQKLKYVKIQFLTTYRLLEQQCEVRHRDKKESKEKVFRFLFGTSKIFLSSLIRLVL